MKVSELSEKAGIPLPTIKFYIRQGLLPPGDRTSRNQAEYGPSHLERLALIKALQHDAGLGLDAIARALQAADRATEGDFIVAAIDAVERPARAEVDPSTEAFARAKKKVLALAARRGWALGERDVSVLDAARALTVIERAFPYGGASNLEPYGEAVSIIAEHEIPEAWAPAESPESALRYAMLGTVLYEPLILALRRMAHVARARKVMAQGEKTKKAPRRRR
jgi:DNA-binding transcriptional MerR regulator